MYSPSLSSKGNFIVLAPQYCSRSISKEGESEYCVNVVGSGSMLRLSAGMILDEIKAKTFDHFPHGNIKSKPEMDGK